MARGRGIVGLVAIAALFAGLALSAPAGAAVTACRSAHLGIWAGPTSGAAGTIVSEFAFVNTGTATCSLSGYPRIQMLEVSGARLSTIDSNAVGFLGVTKPAVVVIAPGKRAYFGAAYPDFTGAGQTRCPTSAALDFTPPGGGQPIELTGPKAHITPYAGGEVRLHCGVVRMTAIVAKRFQ
jgi:hypothetical protein